MKHINVTYHFICKRVASDKVALTYVQLKENPVELMTKALELMTKVLDLFQHWYLCKKLGFQGTLQIEGDCWSITRSWWFRGASGSTLEEIRGISRYRGSSRQYFSLKIILSPGLNIYKGSNFFAIEHPNGTHIIPLIYRLWAPTVINIKSKLPCAYLSLNLISQAHGYK